MDGDLPGARLVARPARGQAVYLAFTRGSEARASVAALGETNAIRPGILLVTGASDRVESAGLPGVEIARLARTRVWPGARVPAVPPSPAAAGRALAWQQAVQDMVDAVSGASLMADLTSLVGFVTRYSTTTGCANAGAWLAGQFSGLGLTVTTQNHTSGHAPNVIAELPGSVTPDEIVTVCGHYDSTSPSPTTNAPGADDNGTGTAATLQAARIMAGYEFERTLRFIAFSGEEQGLYGSED